jgi:ornithine cyclodeaminase/alanine dehydrogenase-like protein (mu-crystallin family)
MVRGFAKTQSDLGYPATACASAQEAIDGANITCTATSAQVPCPAKRSRIATVVSSKVMGKLAVGTDL